jgi:hypothetical protein
MPLFLSSLSVCYSLDVRDIYALQSHLSTFLLIDAFICMVALDARVMSLWE